MSLRLQLLALGTLTLLLPWAGVRLVQQVEASLRTGHEQYLVDNARAHIVTTRLADSARLRTASPAAGLSDALYAHSLTRPPLIDGFQGDWNYLRDLTTGANAAREQRIADGSRFWLGVSGISLYLYIEVTDDEVVYQAAPGEAPHGDRVELIIGSDAGSRSLMLLANSASGSFQAQPTTGEPSYTATGSYIPNVYGAWQATANGYAIEAQIPMRLVDGAIGIGIIDSDQGGDAAGFAGVTWRSADAPNALVTESAELNRILAPFAGGSDRIRIMDADGFVLADSGSEAPDLLAATGTTPSLVERMFRYLLRRDDPVYEAIESAPGLIGDPSLRRVLTGEDSTAWFRRDSEASATVAAAVPVDAGDPSRGALILEQASDPILTLTNQAMMRLMTTTVLIIVLVAGGLLAYASLLSLRVSRLASATESALGPKGEIRTSLPGTRVGDEIGDLSRAIGDLLGRLRDYTDYLKSLKSKLSHELRTPLAIVATSLDNLEHEMHTESSREYLERLRHGAVRLEAILQAMTAATRVEQAITQADSERFDLVAVVSSCVSAYPDVYAGQAFEIRLPDQAFEIRGSAELIEQMLDKLIDNASGFAADGSAIRVSLDCTDQRARLTVENKGPLLPESMRHQLFDSLVSVRNAGDDRTHLGLGLYIVMLIAEFHGGQADAANLEDSSGVRFSIDLPGADAGTA